MQSLHTTLEDIINDFLKCSAHISTSKEIKELPDEIFDLIEIEEQAYYRAGFSYGLAIAAELQKLKEKT